MSETAPPRSRKPRGQGHERRPEILAAAKRLFIAEGYQGFTTRKLAASVGLSQTGLYVYFASKEEIFDALCRQSFEHLAQVFREVAARGGGEGFERLRALGHAFIDFGLAHPDEYRLTFMDGPGLLKMADPDPRAAARPLDQQGIANQVFGLLSESVRDLARAGALRPLDPMLATHTVLFSLHGLVSMFIARPRFPKAGRDELIEATLDSVVESLRRAGD